MSINTVAKGNRRQNAARKKLESEGWLVYVVPRLLYGPVDLWGLFDIAAYKDGYIRLIQIKSNVCPKSVKDAIRAFTTDGLFVRREVWVYKDYSKLNPFVEVMIGGQ